MKKLALIKRDSHSAGGLEKMTSLILDALTAKGADVSVFSTDCYQPRGLIKAQKIKDFDRYLSTKTASFDVIFSMDRASRQTHHRAGNGVHAAYLNLRAQTEGRLKKWSFAANPLHRMHLQLEKQTFESPQTQIIIVNSAMVRSQILHYYNTPASKIHVIHNSINYNEIESNFYDRKHYASQLGLDPSLFQFVFIGNNFQRKGLDPLLKALAQLSSKHFHLSVIGTDKNSASYAALAARLKIKDHVTFFGAQNSRPFYKAADCLVIPSLYDPFANVTVEALSLGLFVVSSKTNGGHEILQPHSGVIVDNPHSVEEMAASLEVAFKYPKTFPSAHLIRQTVSHLDHSFQLSKICALCLG